MTVLMQLKQIQAELAEVIASLEDDGGPVEQPWVLKPLPADAKAAYFACHALWNAAQADYRLGKGWKNPDGSLFNIFDYIEGLLPLGQHRAPPKTSEEMQSDITALGFCPQGKAWLGFPENTSQLDQAYQRHFLGYITVRVNQNDDSQGYIKKP